MESLYDILQCSVCFRTSASPIHTCTNGHVVCGICIDTRVYNECPDCGEELAVSSLAERTARRNEFILQCPNTDQGCTKSVRSTQMRDHIYASCGYRPISCLFRGLDACQENAIQIRDVFNHLTTVHRLVTLPDSISGKIDSRNYFQTFDDDFDVVGKRFDGKEFLSYKYGKNGVVYDWIAVLGDKEVADRYKVVLRCPERPPNSTVPTSQYSEFTWRFPVVPVHESGLERVKERGQVATMHWTALVPHCQEREREDNVLCRYSWQDNIEILKV